jgi:hypothetical protein
MQHRNLSEQTMTTAPCQGPGAGRRNTSAERGNTEVGHGKTSSLLRRLAGAVLVLTLAGGGIACSDDDTTDVVEGSEFVDETPGESFEVDSQADLACVNAFESAAADEAPLSVTLEACVDAEQWYDVAGGFADLVEPDAQAAALEQLCAEAGGTGETFC